MKKKNLQLIVVILILLSLAMFPVTQGDSYNLFLKTDHKETDSTSLENNILNPKKYWALLVAINNYPSGSLLPYSINEITNFKQTLLDSANWNETHIQSLVNQEASQYGISASFEWLKGNVDENDVVIFYFVGHGSYAEGNYYLKLYDKKLKDVDLDAYLDQINCTVVTILDACYSGGFIDELQQENRVILTACKKDENTYQVSKLRSGIFGYFLNLTIESYTKFAENSFILTWMFSVHYSNQLSHYYNESYTIHPQMYDGTLLRTRLVYRHVKMKNVFMEFFSSLLSMKHNRIFAM